MSEQTADARDVEHLSGFDCLGCGHSAMAHYRNLGCRACEREGRPFCNTDPLCWCGVLGSKHVAPAQ